MNDYAHGFGIDQAVCDGCLACMRACPTNAIRVKHGKAKVLTELCIDCGSCLRACPIGAISATTRTMDSIGHIAFKVAVPSPVLFTQFPRDVRPEHIVQGLLAAGFDAVWDYGIDLALITRATDDYVERWDGPRPLISIMCPVIVRLLQVAYPRMLDQLINVRPARDIAGREIKRRYADERGLAPEQLAAIYVTPCQARTVAIQQPAEGGPGYLDGAIGIEQVYNTVLAETREAVRAGVPPGAWSPVRSTAILRWATRRPFAELLRRHRYVSVTGLPNVIRVFDDIEKGKLKDIDFLDCFACWGGCTNGNLTVDNVYVSLAKLQSLWGGLPELDAETAAEVERRYPDEDFAMDPPPQPRAAAQVADLRERVRRVKETERIAAELPGVNCGLCGTPGCKVLAHDVAAGLADKTDCVFLSKRRLDELRAIHLHKDAPDAET
jgi:Na+-translocating ferredoxin:NAD+ oxidoreductase RNF subunit RnfB